MGSEPASEDVVAPAPSASACVAEARLDETWVLKVADEAALSAKWSHPGWMELAIKRDLASAVRTLGPLGGLAAARAHAEAAAMYRQAALISAYSLIEVYGKTPEPTDPVGANHLLAVSYAITGDLEKARAASSRTVEGDPSAPWAAAWTAWFAAGGAWPPDLSMLPKDDAGNPAGLPKVEVGSWPEATTAPHYALPEQGVDSKRDLADPGALVALALWHDAAAKLAAGADYPQVLAYRAGYRLPIEGAIPAGGPSADEILFGSDLLVAADADFLAAVTDPAIGMSAVETFREKSLLAELTVLTRVDGKMNMEQAGTVIGELRTCLVDRAVTLNNGAQAGHHRQFADIAFVGALRSLALVAEVEGDREVSGLLRINALERSSKATADPVGMLALGAWDASNRYPLRALDIVHAHAKRYPSLEIARYGLDVLGLRVSSERTGETPGM